MAFQFIPKAFDGVKVRALCRPVKLFHTYLDKPFLYGPRFVHRVIVMLKQERAFPKLLHQVRITQSSRIIQKCLEGQDSREEGKTKPIPPQETEKIWHGSSDPQKALQLHHQEHGCITSWYGNCLASDLKARQRVVRTAQNITGAKLPAIQDLYTRRCQRKALKIVKESRHPSQRLFSLLLHSKH